MPQMGSRARWRQSWAPQPLTPLIEGPGPEMQEEGTKKESSWEVIREWFRTQKISPGGSFSQSFYGTIHAKTQDLRLLLGVLGCPLAPIPSAHDPTLSIHIKDTPFVKSLSLSLSLHFNMLPFLFEQNLMCFLLVLLMLLSYHY